MPTHLLQDIDAIAARVGGVLADAGDNALPVRKLHAFGSNASPRNTRVILVLINKKRLNDT